MSSGLYALKPWYARSLGGVRRRLAARGVNPNAVTVAGVGFGALAGVVLAAGLDPVPAAVLVGVLMAARLAAANLDGALARETGRCTPGGAVGNELGDRAAELCVLAGCLAVAPAWVVLAAMVAASAPSWVALAGAAAGGPRINGGPVGKTERCLLLTVLAAVPAQAVPLLLVLAAGSVLTAGLRLRTLLGGFRASAAGGPAAAGLRTTTDSY